jgi:hypothetical protein
MSFSTDSQVFAWIGRPARGLNVYAEVFGEAAVEIMGESPYLNARTAGISFALTTRHDVQTVFLYADGIEDFAQYAGALPACLSFGSSRNDVRAAMGDPVMSADAGGVGLMAIDYAFDRFEDGKYYLRFEYAPGDTAIRLVTFGLCADW